MILAIIVVPILLGIIIGATAASFPVLFSLPILLTVLYLHEMMRPGGILDQFELTERPNNK